MLAKKDLQLIVCPCAFEPRALAREASTFSSVTLDPLSSARS